MCTLQWALHDIKHFKSVAITVDAKVSSVEVDAGVKVAELSPNSSPGSSLQAMWLCWGDQL